jgi:hypothetical protein
VSVRTLTAAAAEHYPPAASLAPTRQRIPLPAKVADGWKKRLRTRLKTVVADTGEKTVVTVERISYRQCLTPVRALFLDIAQWAIEDPGRWARWVAPCPVGQEEINQRKTSRHRKSRMDARTRERLPVLPVLVRTVDGRRKASEALLRAAGQTRPRGHLHRQRTDPNPIHHHAPNRRQDLGR